MNSLVNYIMESGISLSLFALIYLFFLRKETFFRTNRLFLLLSVAFSLVLPLLTIPVYAPEPLSLPQVTVTPYANLLETVVVRTHHLAGEVESFVISSKLILELYFTGLAIMCFMLFVQLFQIYRFIRKGTVLPQNGYKLVLIEKVTSPFSFLNYLFIQNNYQQIPGYRKMLDHELEHIRQGHTFDILLLDILLIFQWFNPFIWLLKRVVRENHEYLADRAVLHSGIKPAEYKLLLLSQVTDNVVYAANHFNYSLLKNRFKMMTKIPSPKKAGIKIISGVLIAMALVVVFACEQKKSATDTLKTGKDSLMADLENRQVRISGSQEEISKLREILTSGNYTVSADDENGRSFLLLQEKGTKPDSLLAGNLSTEGSNEVPEDVFVIVEKMPQFPGGDAALLNFISKQVKYPDIAVEKGIQGKVIIRFVVTRDGSVKNAKVLRGVAPSLDKEALRVVNLLPKWTPGEQRGKRVDVYYTIPISFQLR